MVETMLRWVTPNRLTWGRIGVIPVLLVLIWLQRPAGNYAAVTLFLLACITDYFDGMLARQRGEITQLGKLLDPIADKMLILSTLILMVGMGIADTLPTILIAMRELAVGGLRSVAAAEGVVIAAAPGAKWKTAFQMGATGALMLHHNPLSLRFDLLGQALLWFATAWTLWTGYSYFSHYFRASGR